MRAFRIQLQFKWAAQLYCPTWVNPGITTGNYYHPTLQILGEMGQGMAEVPDSAGTLGSQVGRRYTKGEETHPSIAPWHCCYCPHLSWAVGRGGRYPDPLLPHSWAWLEQWQWHSGSFFQLLLPARFMFSVFPVGWGTSTERRNLDSATIVPGQIQVLM